VFSAALYFLPSQPQSNPPRFYIVTILPARAVRPTPCSAARVPRRRCLSSTYSNPADRRVSYSQSSPIHHENLSHSDPMSATSAPPPNFRHQHQCCRSPHNPTQIRSLPIHCVQLLPFVNCPHGAGAFPALSLRLIAVTIIHHIPLYTTRMHSFLLHCCIVPLPPLHTSNLHLQLPRISLGLCVHVFSSHSLSIIASLCLCLFASVSMCHSQFLLFRTEK